MRLARRWIASTCDLESSVATWQLRARNERHYLYRLAPNCAAGELVEEFVELARI
jgi:hypothetical protein